VSVIGRAFVSIFVFAAVFFFSYWLLFVQIIPGDPSGLASLAALLTAMVLAGLTWSGTGGGAHGVLATALTWSAIVGAVGFSGGFFGPMIFTPDANQGPLLGLLITGPLGCVVGAVGGLIVSLWRGLNTRAA
jgi:hypothetical protein